LVLLWEFREAVILFLLSLAISAAFHPLIDSLVERKVPRNLALILSYAAVLAVILGLFWVTGGSLLRDIEALSNELAVTYERLHTVWLESGSPFQQNLAGLTPPPEDLFGEIMDEGQVPVVVQGILDFTSSMAGILQSLGLILILSIYWSADRRHFERLLLSLIAVDKRPPVRMAWRGIEKGVGAYIRSELFQSLLAGFLLWLGYRLMGLDYPVLLAVFGALAWLIPWFGAVIAMIPPFLVGFTISPVMGFAAALYTLIVLVVEEFVIEPRIFRRSSYSAVILVIVILALTDALGLVGLVLAPLVSATIQNIFKYMVPPAASTESTSLRAPTETLPTIPLRERLAQAREAFVDAGGAPSLEIGSLMERLDLLIGQTERYLEGNPGDSTSPGAASTASAIIKADRIQQPDSELF
jgi:predicted PurR-regulated permease PerM